MKTQSKTLGGAGTSNPGSTYERLVLEIELVTRHPGSPKDFSEYSLRKLLEGSSVNNGSPGIRTQDQSVKSRVLYR